VLSVSLGAGAVVALVAVAAVAVLMGIEARQESARAVAARDFMLNIFARANQEKSRGADITARDLLETGRKDVLTRLAGQPRLQAELLRGIAKIQGDMGEYASADGTYAELVRLNGLLSEPGQEASARAEQAYNAYQMGNPLLAASLLQRAKDVRNRPTNDAELNARISELDGWIAINKGDFTGARELLRLARQRSAQALGPNHLRTFRLGQALLRAEGQLRSVDAALALHAELRQVATQVEGVDDSELSTMDWEQVNLLQDAGHFAQALKLVDAALPMCIATQGPDGKDCRLLFLLRVRVMLRLGLVERALGDLPRLSALANDQKWPYIRVESMLLHFRLTSRVAATTDLRSVADQVRVFGQSGADVPMNPIFKATALLALAESSLLRGDPQSAQNWVEQARAKLAQSGVVSSNIKFAALAHELIGVAFLQQGDAERALVEMSDAGVSFSGAFGHDHAMTQLMALNTATALDALGRTGEALAIVASAEPILKLALGLASPAYDRVRALRKHLEARTQNEGGLPAQPGVANGRRELPAVRFPEFFS
jgi:eukaryotic-like serine/threonine-protein kinase